MDQDFHNNDVDRPLNAFEKPINSMDFESSNRSSKSKSSLRLKYEAEKKVLEKQLGSLEDIRSELGLSQRKMAQLLLVDPSAWTRWIKEPEKVPPHVYRSLQWYMELTKKKPEWAPQNSFGPLTTRVNNTSESSLSAKDDHDMKMEIQNLRFQSEKYAEQVENLQEALREQAQVFSERVENKDTALAIWKLFVLMNSVILFFWFVWNLL